MELRSRLRTSAKYINTLKEKGIEKPKDFFYYFPKDYEDRTSIKSIWELQEWVKAVVKAKIVDTNFIKTPRWKKIMEFQLQDKDQNIAYASFMNATYLLRTLKKWNTILLSWKPKFSYGKYTFWFPEILSDNFDDDLVNVNLVWKIVPIYSDLSWIKWSWFQKKISDKIDDIDNLYKEFLPSYLIEKYNLLWIKQALKNIHFPDNMEALKQAKYRFNFEQLLIWQLITNINAVDEKKWQATQPQRDIIKEFLTYIPFELTKAQKKAIKTIIDDMHSWSTMMRLLQWDVWSWKTVVATTVAFYLMKQNNKQIAFLAPTEVLAKQHIAGISKFLLPLWYKMALLTWSTKKSEKDQIKQDLREGNLDFVVWTHAIIQDDVEFKNLWLVIVDEQHKFWVKQRVKLSSQWHPHMLQMTATPIPRSLALSYFWEFENTIIDELPPWRQEIHTKVISEDEYIKLKQFLINKIRQDQQVYVVSPLIEESEKLEDVNSAFQEYEKVVEMFPELKDKIGLMHGRLKADEKAKVMWDFQSWKTKILVSTTVIEVWVDVPNATIMIIKNSERFGLSSLHQLRWRVGRWSLQSYCFLATKSKSWESYRRLKYMEKYSDGFKLAEIDLNLRWAGTILGTQQSWDMDLPEEALKDIHLLESTRAEAKHILKHNILEKETKLKKLVDKKINYSKLMG